MHEIRLRYKCGCVDRFEVVNEPRPEEVEMQARDECRDCQAKHWKLPEQVLELLAEARSQTRRRRKSGG